METPVSNNNNHVLEGKTVLVEMVRQFLIAVYVGLSHW